MKEVYSNSTGEIARITGGSIAAGTENQKISVISSDSRDLGDGALFVPLIGERFDGHNFLADLINEKKIAAALTSVNGFEEAAQKQGVSLIHCDDTLAALGRIGADHRASLDTQIIGITGTNGKTTTKELLHTVLSGSCCAFKNEKNYNNEIGVPFSLLALNSLHEKGVVEMGMNHPGEIERLSRIVQPDLALITNIGEGHLEFLGSLEGVAAAKSEIVAGMKPGSLILVNGETACFDLVAHAAADAGMKLKTYGAGEGFDYSPESYSLSREGVELTWKGSDFSVPLYGVHNVYNIMAVIAAASEMGLTSDEIKNSLAGVNNVDGRSQIMEMGYIVVNDTYNSNPLSSRFALRSVSEIFPERRKFAVLADMKELGDAAPQCHRDIGREAADLNFDFLLVWGEMGDEYLKGAAGAQIAPSALHFETKQELIEYLKTELVDKDVVLVKGSRSTRMEEVVKALEK